MSYHGGPLDSIRNLIAKKADLVDSEKHKRGIVIVRLRKRQAMSYEEKMKIPAYAEVVERNKKHGISTPHYGKQRARGLNVASKYKNRYKKKRFVSLPKITMPMGDEE